ncbi:hypothetical protein [Clostridium algidicarnis]|uniref:hypothetical protein n=1 Tax=Clostridium algidicarnis TaxID=37659 RepID=UPI001C0B4BE4|nr:hypothetical protein [Clostridium algidicarnis]MBU3209536.1 hypothetical protein [Clostridium algidicarnis]MBU3227209.1 hypothetical protein [Clostridium algidicarnis]
MGYYFIIYANDNISIKIYNTVKEKENIYSTVLVELQKINGFSPIHNIEIEVETEEFKKEIIKKL